MVFSGILLMGFFSNLGSIAGAAALPFVGSTALSMGSSLLDFFGNQQTNNQNASNVAATNAANTANANAANAEQLQLAEHGLSMKIADAAQYGISPLAAIGGVDPSYNPAIPVLNTPQYTSPLVGAGQGLSTMGQDITRALGAYQSPEERISAQLSLQHQSLENEYMDTMVKNAQLELSRNAATPGIAKSYVPVLNADGTTSVIPNPTFAYGIAHGGPFSGVSWMLNNKLSPAVDSLGPNLGVQVVPQPGADYGVPGNYLPYGGD